MDNRPSSKAKQRRISILGATGSIGKSTLSIVETHPDLYKVVAVTGGGNVARLVEIARATRAEFVAIADETKLGELKEALSSLPCEVASGDAGIIEAAKMSCDMTISAIVGFAGLAPTLAALDACETLALANKESLVCAGTLVRKKAAANNVELLPMDSEHNAIFQALNGEKIDSVEKVTLTASGGPFRTWSKAQIAEAGPEQALKHPNWSMGAKITIDSATLMNKGLEVIEAHHLFPIRHDQLDVVVHPESIIHGMVSFIDGAVIAELGCPDMRTPIAHCMGHPERISAPVERLNLAKLGSLTFEEPDYDRFPMLGLALEALVKGDIATNLLNAANEIAVHQFLNNGLSFYGMSDLVANVLDEGLKNFSSSQSIESLEEAIEVDHFARNKGFDFMKVAS
ncbi:MAG: 1-deoxy-D-xylulose-5-phosphate reductoisomerase [Hyphomicrobiales bacterium]